MKEHSPLASLRLTYKPKSFLDITTLKQIYTKTPRENISNQLQEIFPKTFNRSIVYFENTSNENVDKKALKIGVVFSGGQAPGGHNVITGIFDTIKTWNEISCLIGFLKGPDGILENNFIEITENLLKDFRNQGGFDLLESGRTKIETQEQLETAKNTAEKLNLDGLIIIGGDDSNTNAAILAEYFLQNGCNTKVVGIPKTIDGDLKNEHIPVSFGFDTATKVYSDLIGNIQRDALSAQKYYHFVKLMGRSASHIALECALQTHPNYVFIGEEIKKENKTLSELVDILVTLVYERYKKGKNFGVVLIPEGLIEFIPEIKNLIEELNSCLAEKSDEFNSIATSEEKIDFILKSDFISEDAKKTFSCLPEKIQAQFLLDRDPHGNVQVSKIETEKLLMEMTKKRLSEKEDFKGKFNAQAHFFGYEGRAELPSNFDADYCYMLGQSGALFIKENLTGYISSISFQDKKIKAVPLVSLMNMEMRKGKEKPVIKKALVDLSCLPFQTMVKFRKNWMFEDDYMYPGPIQYFGDLIITDNTSLTMKLENKKNV